MSLDLQRAQERVRATIVERLRLGLVGPSSPDEEISDRPSDRYLTAILYPVQSEISNADDEGLSAEGGARDEMAPDDSGVALTSTLKPSAAGVSFALELSSDEPYLKARVRCGTYHLVEKEESSGSTPTPKRWKRVDHDELLGPIRVKSGSTRQSLADVGLTGLELHIQVASWRGTTVTVTAALVNTRGRGKIRNESEELTFFQTELEIICAKDCRFVERPSRRAAIDDDERVASVIYSAARELASGHTCSANWTGSPEGVETVKTDWMPEVRIDGISEGGADVFRQIRNDGGMKAAWLGTADKMEVLNALRDLITAYEDWIDRQSREGIAELPPALRPQGLDNLEVCRQGARRMRGSVAFLERDLAAFRAFQLAQGAMDRQRMWAKKQPLEWRPFQLAFQLLTIESTANRAHPNREVMDLLWFPTGGGKTEAYLALTAFITIYRRLNGTKDDDGSGIAVLMRYTLRLLTVQQFQRAAAMICACELVRRDNPELGTVPISIGLWVGNGMTPDTRENARKPTGQETHKQLTACPACQSPLPNWQVLRTGMKVCCENDECDFGGTPLPVWTIDEDIYEFTPSLLIGTVDKFAQIVRKTDTVALFGRGAVKHHPPELIIQDELHLISGPLGSMSGLYESAIDELCRVGGSRAKVIGSTATIRRARQQIRSLFNRGTYQFPAPALSARDSGFSVVDPDKPGRIYVGLTTAGRSAKYAVQAVAASLLQAAAAPAISDDQRDPYWTLVSYFNTLRELGGSLVLMQDDVPISMRQIAARSGEPQRPINPPRELTGGVSALQVRDILDELTVRVGDGAIDVLLASSMISVGVDIPRLGLMMVVGQPKTIAEYIQATSRVGRDTIPGLIVGIYNSSRSRDRAFFETFRTWHQTLYRDVEATSVTPFAPRAQDKALHAVIVALARHLMPSMREDPPRLTKKARQELEQLLQPILGRATTVDSSEAGGVMNRVKRLLDEWEMASGLEAYWDDFGRKRTLLISAEQEAAGEEDSDDPRALWGTPNSMRDVEASTSFRVARGLAVIGGSDGQ